MLYSTLLFVSFYMDFGIAETGISRGSPPGTTTEVLRVGFPSAENRVVSVCQNHVATGVLLVLGANSTSNHNTHTATTAKTTRKPANQKGAVRPRIGGG
jgi:ribosomal protein L4